MRIFETLKPRNKFLRKFICYYYIDFADGNDYFNEYICYPHYNNTISLYKNHDISFKDGHSIISLKKKTFYLFKFLIH